MKQALILFTRVPVQGKTKTRLQAALTPAQCVEVHCAFLQDLFAACNDPRWDLLVFYGQEGPLSILQELLPDQRQFFPQQGNILGEKMDNAIAQTLAMGYDRCVLVGADLPELHRGIIAAAMQSLDQSPLVLGPTMDGGYYLIGSRMRCSFVFAGQSYGGSTVFEQTMAAIKAAGYCCRTVQPLHDVDSPQDLRALADRLHQQPAACAHSRQFLRRLGWM